MVILSWPWSLREFTQFIWWMQTERRVAANPQTKPTDFGCESPPINGCYHPHIPSLFVIITQPESWCSFYRPTEGGRLSRPRHYMKSAQPARAQGCNITVAVVINITGRGLSHRSQSFHRETIATYRGTWVWKTCLRLLLDNVAVGNWTRNHRVASPTP